MGSIELGLIVQNAINASREGDFATIDEKLIPEIKEAQDRGEIDGNELACVLLVYTEDPEEDTRDTVYTFLAVTHVTDQQLKEDIVARASSAVLKDRGRFVVGRAAMVLKKYQDEEKLSSQVEQSLRIFKNRVETEGWKKELFENIPGIDEIFIND